ncbi:transcription factor Ovo-like 2 [Strongylocentrotus purpuratus]|uniref:C2H2-type domain-containing protein n=1 Tax=Strongylocentrotus purpuratus TaxID=7668 RepID=A0A7M7NCT6_STRPU|nr:transcription factor Ovo-like 2 [Strongylocentrotus purpuratus]
MSPNKLPSNGLTTPDSTSLPSTKPPYSTAEAAEPTPVYGIKPKPRCSQCLSIFPTERAYTKHMTTDHSQTKPHICGFCGKGFHDKFDLKRHYRTHTGVGPYKCSQCSRSFTQRCSLETHVNKVHEMPLAFTFKERREKIYVCEDCGHSVKDAFEHYLHMWVAHSRLAKPKRLRQKVLHRIKYILKAQNGDRNRVLRAFEIPRLRRASTSQQSADADKSRPWITVRSHGHPGEDDQVSMVVYQRSHTPSDANKT